MIDLHKFKYQVKKTSLERHDTESSFSTRPLFITRQASTILYFLWFPTAAVAQSVWKLGYGLVHAHDVNILVENIRRHNENTWPILQVRKVGLEVDNKTKYMVMYCHQNGVQNHNLMTVNESYENVAEFKYLWKTVTNQNCFQEEIKSRLNSCNVCHRSAQNL